MNLTVETPPAVEPVTLTEAKAHLRVDTTDHDATITALITAAREFVEKYSGRALIDQTLSVQYAAFTHRLMMPRAPISAISAVQYYDTDNASQTLASSVYVLDRVHLPGRVVRASGQSWPSTYVRPDAVKITFVAGYGATAAAVPETIKHALKLSIEQMFDGTDTHEPVEALLAAYMLPMFADCGAP